MEKLGNYHIVRFILSFKNKPYSTVKVSSLAVFMAITSTSYSFANTSSSIALSWQDNSDNESGLIVEHKYNDSGEYIKLYNGPKDITSHQVRTNLAGDHCFRIVAYNEAGRAESDERCIHLDM